jgi:hypothetical protein
MNAGAFRTNLDEALSALASQELISLSNAHYVREIAAKMFKVKYNEATGMPAYPRCGFSFLEEYFFYRWSVFSAVLNDGSLIQMDYDVDADGIVRHRLNFFPCVASLNVANIDFEQSSIEDEVKRIIRTDPLEHIRPYTAIRFDYERNMPDQSHPACHATLLRSDCRIPVSRPLSPSRFMRFICENFYPEIYGAVEESFQTLSFETEEDIADDFKHRMRLEIPAKPQSVQ